MLRDCLEVTDWSVFKESCVDLNEYTEVVTSYISFVRQCVYLLKL